ncbi:MAG: PAS domain S-box protein [Chloroflexi bacterium]|nr:PAS domain S-box protein [Chloroflexota bacterium]
MSKFNLSTSFSDQLYALAQERNIDLETLVNDLLVCEQLTNLSLDILITMSRDGKLHRANPALEKTLGYSSDELIGKSFWEFFHSKDRTLAQQKLQHSGNEQSLTTFTSRCQTASGDYCRIAWTARSDNNFIYAVGRDITQATKLEQAQAELELLQSMADGIPYMVYVYDVPLASTIFANAFVLNYYNITLEELQADSQKFFADRIHPDDLASLETFNTQWATASDEDVFSNSYRMRGADNEYRWFRSYDTVFSRDVNGNVKQILGTSIDITEQRNAENLVRKQQSLLKQSAKFSKIGTWEWDLIDDTFEWSSEVCDMLEIAPDATEPTFTNFLKYVHPNDRVYLLESAQQALETGLLWTTEYRIITPGGDIKWLWSGGESVYDEEGELKGLVGTLYDITHHKQVEQRLLESEQRYRTLFEQATDGIVLIDPETKQFVQHNRAAYELVGHTETSFRSLDMTLLGQTKHLERVLDEGQYQEELLVPTGDGDIRYLSVHTTIITLNGKTYLLSFWRDITQQKYIENALFFTAQAGWSENSTDFLQALVTYLTNRLDVDYAFIGELVETGDAVITLVVSHGDEILDNFRYELSGSPCEHVFKHNMAVFPQNVQHTFPDDAGLVHLDVEGYMGIQLWDSNGAPLGIIVLMSKKPLTRVSLARSIMQIVAVRAAHEVERMRITAEMRESERRYRTLLENAPVALIIINRDGQIKFINRETAALFDYDEEELIDRPFDRLIPIEERSSHSHHFDTFIQNPENRAMGIGLSISGVRSDGTTFPTDVALSYIVIDDAVHYVAFIVDLSDRLQAERAAHLQQELEREKELRELKSRFLSMVAHDFRTPLTLIMSSTGLVRMLGDKITSDQRDTSLQKIDRQVERLSKLLDEVSFINRNELSGHKLQLTPVSMVTFLKQIVDEVTYSTPKPITITLACGDPDIYLLDELLLHQIFSNLVSNAVKYSKQDEGKVVIACNVVDDWLRIDVSDKGIGIPEEDQKYIFEVFHRARNVGNISGSGLGLAIVKTAVEAHGGRIDFESEVGKGTTFRVQLPAQSIKADVSR